MKSTNIFQTIASSLIPPKWVIFHDPCFTFKLPHPPSFNSEISATKFRWMFVEGQRFAFLNSGLLLKTDENRHIYEPQVFIYSFNYILCSHQISNSLYAAVVALMSVEVPRWWSCRRVSFGSVCFSSD